ncbi:MAG: ABC transporter permease subunit [Myxococcota bacterium]
MVWWIRPLVRFIAALSLPLIVPTIITLIIWALPGDPATTICPPVTCPDTAREHLVETYSLRSPYSDGIRNAFGAPTQALEAGYDSSVGVIPQAEPLTWFQYGGETLAGTVDAFFFLAAWLSHAVAFDFGRSPVVFTGFEVSDLLVSSIPNTASLMLVALIPILLGTFGAATGWLPRRLDGLLSGIGVVPSVIFALFVVAALTINLGPDDPLSTNLEWGQLYWDVQPLKLLAGGLVLGLADGALSGAVTGTRSSFETEMKQRYIGIAILRGEGVFSNALPNVLPTLVGQLRGRVLHLLSGTVIVEVVLQLDGLGDLLWRGTLGNDYFVVLAAAWGFSLLSAVMLFVQAASEVGVAMLIRRSPKVAA